MERGARIRSFIERADRAPDGVLHLPGVGALILINPMADEAELLETLGIEPSACLKVDGYWRSMSDVHFVQIQSAEAAAGRRSGLYVRHEGSVAYDLNFVAVVEETPIDRPIVEHVMRRFAELESTDLPRTAGLQRIDAPEGR